MKTVIGDSSVNKSEWEGGCETKMSFSYADGGNEALNVFVIAGKKASGHQGFTVREAENTDWVQVSIDFNGTMERGEFIDAIIDFADKLKAERGKQTIPSELKELLTDIAGDGCMSCMLACPGTEDVTRTTCNPLEFCNDGPEVYVPKTDNDFFRFPECVIKDWIK